MAKLRAWKSQIIRLGLNSYGSLVHNHDVQSSMPQDLSSCMTNASGETPKPSRISQTSRLGGYSRNRWKRCSWVSVQECQPR